MTENPIHLELTEDETDSRTIRTVEWSYPWLCPLKRFVRVYVVSTDKEHEIWPDCAWVLSVSFSVIQRLFVFGSKI